MIDFVPNDFLDQQETHDVWEGRKNPQTIHDVSQANAALSLGRDLIKLPSNKVMIESEFKTFDSIMKSLPQSKLSINKLAPIQNQPVIESNSIIQNNSFEFQLNQKGIITLALIFSGCLVVTMSLIKIWGTTDVAQQQAYQERIDNQYNEIGKRYDKLAKVTEKLGKKSDVCVSFYCAARNQEDLAIEPKETREPQVATSNYGSINYSLADNSQLDNEDYYQALIEVTRWKRDGHSKSKAIAFISWIQKNPRVAKSEGYPSYSAVNKAFHEIYN